MPAKMPKTISLAEIMRSGRIAPLEFGMPLLDVAELLGPPIWWMEGGYGGEPMPLLWGYAGGLEVHFDIENPHGLRWYKLGLPRYPSPRTMQFTRFVRMRNDATVFGVPLSAVLRNGLWDLAKVEVGICYEEFSPMMDICVGTIPLPFTLRSDDEEPLRSRLENPDLTLDERIAALDHHSFCGDVYFPDRNPGEDRPFSKWWTLRATEYLERLDSYS